MKPRGFVQVQVTRFPWSRILCSALANPRGQTFEMGFDCLCHGSVVGSKSLLTWGSCRCVGRSGNILSFVKREVKRGGIELLLLTIFNKVTLKSFRNFGGRWHRADSIDPFARAMAAGSLALISSDFRTSAQRGGIFQHLFGARAFRIDRDLADDFGSWGERSAARSGLRLLPIGLQLTTAAKQKIVDSRHCAYPSFASKRRAKVGRRTQLCS